MPGFYFFQLLEHYTIKMDIIMCYLLPNSSVLKLCLLDIIRNHLLPSSKALKLKCTQNRYH